MSLSSPKLSFSVAEIGAILTPFRVRIFSLRPVKLGHESSEENVTDVRRCACVQPAHRQMENWQCDLYELDVQECA